MTKRDIVLQITRDKDIITSEEKLTQLQIAELVQKTLDSIADELIAGGHVELRGFGVFKVVVRKQKVGRNPKKPGTDMIIPEKVVVKFKPSSIIKKNLQHIDISKTKH
jgi:nucleoid DNA-binding protein